MLWEKVGDDDFVLGGQGLAVEFCIFCLTMRVCLFFIDGKVEYICKWSCFCLNLVKKFKEKGNENKNKALHTGK